MHEESEDEPGVYEGAPGADKLDSNDDMDEDAKNPFEIPDSMWHKHHRMSLSLSSKGERRD